MKIYLWIIYGLVFMNGCDRNQNDVFEKIDAYPTAIGNEWTYKSVAILKIFESETSNKVIDADTFITSVTVKVEKDTILNDTLHAIQFTSGTDGLGVTSIYYFFVDSTGLKAYAYAKGAGHAFAKKESAKSIPGIVFPINIFDPTITESDDIHVYKPLPRLNLKLPVELNSKWTYTTPDEPLNLQIDKEVEGYGNIKINNQSFACYKIAWIYIENKFFDDTKIFDWVSKEGLIKRQIIYKRTNINMSGSEPYVNAQLTETILLSELNLQGKNRL